MEWRTPLTDISGGGKYIRGLPKQPQPGTAIIQLPLKWCKMSESLPVWTPLKKCASFACITKMPSGFSLLPWRCSLWLQHRGWIFLLCLRLDAMIDTCLLRAVMTRVVRQQASNWVTLRVKFSVSNTPNAHLVGVWCQQGHRSAQHCLSSQSVAQRHSCSCVYSPPLSHHSCCFSTASISSSDITCL